MIDRIPTAKPRKREANAEIEESQDIILARGRTREQKSGNAIDPGFEAAEDLPKKSRPMQNQFITLPPKAVWEAGKSSKDRKEVKREQQPPPLMDADENSLVSSHSSLSDFSSDALVKSKDQWSALGVPDMKLFSPVLCESEELVACGRNLSVVRSACGRGVSDSTWTGELLFDDLNQVQRVDTWRTTSTASNSQYSYESQAEPVSDPQSTLPLRKRVVGFEYPLVSSVKNCPRPRTMDLPNLFFTDEELQQASNDRKSARHADDIECIHVTAEDWKRSLQNSPKGSDKVFVRKQTRSSHSSNYSNHDSVEDCQRHHQSSLRPTSACEITTQMMRGSFRFFRRCKVPSMEERGLRDDDSLAIFRSRDHIQVCLRERSKRAVNRPSFA